MTIDKVYLITFEDNTIIDCCLSETTARKVWVNEVMEWLVDFLPVNEDSKYVNTTYQFANRYTLITKDVIIEIGTQLHDIWDCDVDTKYEYLHEIEDLLKELDLLKHKIVVQKVHKEPYRSWFW